MASVFFSYSHDDEPHRDQLEKHLALLKRQGLIQAWHDRRILAGNDFGDAIDQELERAEIVLLLVSSSFLASDYCYSREMGRAMERQEAGLARVIPVIVRPCDWHTAPFGRLNAIPRDGKAVSTWANHDEAYAEVARQIRAIVQQPPSSIPTVPARLAATSAVQGTADLLPRTSNLRLKKEFTELDRDGFLQESFEFAARLFEGSLSELQKRNAGTECRFRRVDANTFTAAVYQSGKEASECSICLGGGFRTSSITFSFDASARGSSFNESLSVESDDQSLFLKPLGMNMPRNDQRLTQQGAAEFLWSMLIGRLQ